MKFDVVIIGSGAAGLATAVASAHLGLSVCVLEKEAQFGGTSAWSGGWMWLPRNPLAVKAGIIEPIEAPLTYLKSELRNHYNEELARAFLTNAPKAASFFMENTALQFIDGNGIPDFHENEGAAKGGRSLCAAPFDARALGARVKDLKPPLDTVSPFGMGIAAGAELRHFLNATRKLASFSYTFKQIAKHFVDLAVFGRGMRLVNGNALVARLLKSCDDLGVTLLHSQTVLELVKSGERVTRVKTANDFIEASKGVVLATGGFPHDPQRFDKAHYSAAPLTNKGEGLTLGEKAGGVMATDLAASHAWCPVSLVPFEGGFKHFPHLIERAKPGFMMVLKNGKRFTNEANSYYDVMADLFKYDESCTAIVDSDFINRYGLGRVRPRPFPKGFWVANGYLKTALTLEDLAVQCQIDGASLKQTAEEYNSGSDSFGRGSTAYNRIQGDAENMPNPCLKPLAKPPFYAVKIVAGSLGTFAGLKCSVNGEVLDGSSQPIEGLFAVGNDRVSMMGGHYPAGGITLGPAITFGFMTAHALAGKEII